MINRCLVLSICSLFFDRSLFCMSHFEWLHLLLKTSTKQHTSITSCWWPSFSLYKRTLFSFEMMATPHVSLLTWNWGSVSPKSFSLSLWPFATIQIWVFPWMVVSPNHPQNNHFLLYENPMVVVETHHFRVHPHIVLNTPMVFENLSRKPPDEYQLTAGMCYQGSLLGRSRGIRCVDHGAAAWLMAECMVYRRDRCFMFP